LPLAALGRAGDPEAWSLQLVAIDFNPGAMLGPSIAHDLELQANRRQLRCRRVTNFYCEFFHVLFIPFDCVCFRALAA